jgi:hypothetical protein
MPTQINIMVVKMLHAIMESLIDDTIVPRSRSLVGSVASGLAVDYSVSGLSPEEADEKLTTLSAMTVNACCT